MDDFRGPMELVDGKQRVTAVLEFQENKFKVFGNGILALMGNILIEIGSSLILIGIGVEAIRDSILALTGGPAIAAGLALIVLGGLLSSLSSGGSKAPSSSGTVSSGAAGGTDTSSVGGDLNEDIQEKQTNVKIEVGGTVLDPVSVGLQIAVILNDTFNSTGTKVAVA
jgi:hypothetical protein